MECTWPFVYGGTNPDKRQRPRGILAGQGAEHLLGVADVVGSNPAQDSDFPVVATKLVYYEHSFWPRIKCTVFFHESQWRSQEDMRPDMRANSLFSTLL